jgi:Asp-tRNA(Asn)/Glu-tRNA(Gln) amidotransferase C subunit
MKTQEKIVNRKEFATPRGRHSTASPEIMLYINELQEFLECDMPTKIFPFEIVEGKNWYREDSFKSIKEVEEYLKLHFDTLKKQIKYNEIKNQ